MRAILELKDAEWVEDNCKGGGGGRWLPKNNCSDFPLSDDIMFYALVGKTVIALFDEENDTDANFNDCGSGYWIPNWLIKSVQWVG